MKIHIGEALEHLILMPDRSVHCCCTSPPYWGLRDYGTGTWSGGDANCDHVVGELRRGLGLAKSIYSVRGGGHKAAEVEDIKASGTCPKCGAVRVDRQLGREATPQEYVANLVAVFMEAHRVLRDDGTLWLNLGDSYTSGNRASWNPGTSENKGQSVQRDLSRANTPQGLKPKDLIGIPWMVAFALRDAGWYLRQDIIWAKPNPMPESVTDRCTKSHEHIFLLSKSEKYYYDSQAIAEPLASSSIARLSQPGLEAQPGSDRVPGKTNGPMKAVAKITYGGSDKPYNGQSTKDYAASGAQNASDTKRRIVDRILSGEISTRNKRDVWTVTTKPYKGAHFATFPPDLILPCILAGCPEGGTVLDPFAGSGTTGMVALKNKRDAVLIELNPEYEALILKRCEHLTSTVMAS